jgi:hypothetical protein
LITDHCICRSAAQPLATATATAARPPPDDAARTTADAAARPPPSDATRNTAAAARPLDYAATRNTATAQPTSTHGKPTFAAAGIPDAAHATDVASRPPPAAALSIHNNGDGDWDLAPLDPRTLGNAAATADNGQYGHHVDHGGLQVFNLLS